MLRRVEQGSVGAAVFDPQYRGVLNRLKYGNEGRTRGAARAALLPMTDKLIASFIREISRVLRSSGHLFLWVDKFHLCEGVEEWFDDQLMQRVDLVVWDKGRLGAGYRTRRTSEYLLVFQKPPVRAKGQWTNHSIRDVWSEKLAQRRHTHQKPVELQRTLIAAVTAVGEVVVDPAAGSFSVLDACAAAQRRFLGSDIEDFA